VTDLEEVDATFVEKSLFFLDESKPGMPDGIFAYQKIQVWV
jgi:hypothetical protein